MKLTLEDFLSWPRGMPIETYKKILSQIKYVEKKLYKLGQERDFLEDRLQLLGEDDDKDFEAWNKAYSDLRQVNDEIQSYYRELDRLEAKLT